MWKLLDLFKKILLSSSNGSEKMYFELEDLFISPYSEVMDKNKKWKTMCNKTINLSVIRKMLANVNILI